MHEIKLSKVKQCFKGQIGFRSTEHKREKDEITEMRQKSSGKKFYGLMRPRWTSIEVMERNISTYDAKHTRSSCLISRLGLA